MRAKELALARPGIGISTGGRADPVAGEGKGLAQDRQRCVAWVVVPIEAEVRPRCGSLRGESRRGKQKAEEKENRYAHAITLRGVCVRRGCRGRRRRRICIAR